MTRPRLSVVYLLEDTALFGGVKIVLHQADLMARRGHAVTVVSKGERPSWFPLGAASLRVPDFGPGRLPEADVTVATFWTTVAPASEAVATGRSRAAVHYCQGFEASYTHNRAEHPAILEAYATRLPCFALSPHLAELVRERFGRMARVVPPALAPYWRPAWRLRPRRAARVLIPNPYEIDWKGVATGLEAVRLLRARGIPCRLLRVSQWPLSPAERAALAPDEFHHHLEPRAVAALLRRCDLMLAPSWEQEGFGLPVLEAMGCGVPVVASEISAFRGFAAGSARLVPWNRPERFAGAAAELLADARAWRAARARGVAAAGAFSEERVAEEAEESLYWVAEGRWRSAP